MMLESVTFKWQSSTIELYGKLMIVQNVLSESSDDYQINEIILYYKILSMHDKTSIADKV